MYVQTVHVLVCKSSADFPILNSDYPSLVLTLRGVSHAPTCTATSLKVTFSFFFFFYVCFGVCGSVRRHTCN